MNRFILGLAIISAPAVFSQSTAQFGASKSAFGLLDNLSSRTANVEYRLYVERDGTPNASGQTGDSNYNEIVTSQARTNWTWGFYNDVWKNKLTLAAMTITNDNDQKVFLRQPRLLSTVDAVTTSYFSLVPYMDLYLPVKIS